MGSALDNPTIATDYISEECREGRVIGPLVPERYPCESVN